MNGLSQNRAKQIRALQQKKHRQENGLFLVEGAKTVLETLDSGWPCQTLVGTEAFFNRNRTIHLNPALEILVCSEDQLADLGSFQSNNSALLVARQKPVSENPDNQQGLWLALDGISDPGNLGTIIRLADWFGLKEVITLGNTVEWYSPKVISASMGSFLRINEVQVAPDILTGAGRPVLAADMNGKNLYRFAFPAESILLIGNEAHGVSKAGLEKASDIISIPSFGKAESLNAAMATGIFLNHWRYLQST